MTVLAQKVNIAYLSEYSKMKFTTPKIFHGGKDYDLTKRWYVYYSYIDPISNKMKRQPPVYLNVNKLYKSKLERMNYLTVLRDELEKMLIEGFSPYENNEIKTEYTSESCILYALSVKKSSLAATSYKDYEHKVNEFIKFITLRQINSKPISSVNKIVCQQFLDFILSRSSPINRNNFLSVLSSIFSLLAQNNIIVSNPFLYISHIKSKPKRNRTYSVEQVEEIFEYVSINYPNLYLMIKFVSYNFLRPIECCRLKVGDVLLANNPPILSVKAKNKALKTKIIPTILLKDLIILEQYDAEMYVFTNDGISYSTIGEIQRRDYFTKQFKKVKEYFNLPEDYTIYSFRHTFITKLYREFRKNFGHFEACDKLMLITGHSNIKSLQKYLRDIDAELPEDYSIHLN